VTVSSSRTGLWSRPTNCFYFRRCQTSSPLSGS